MIKLNFNLLTKEMRQRNTAHPYNIIKQEKTNVLG